MSGLENLKTRLLYNGGNAQVGRMQKGKLESLKKALLYSYQSATAILADGREFRCLINRDKLKNEYDDKIISIPFEDVCLNSDKVGKTSEGIEEIGMKPGDVFTWKETNTDWIVFLQRLEETAYFRAEIRRCKYETEIAGKKYKVYMAKPSVDDISWKKAHNILWNELNYSVEMYIGKNEETEDFFHRFKKLEINGQPWEVQGVDDISVDGLIVVALKEDYQNSIEEKIEEEKQVIENQELEEEITTSYIQGDTVVYPYDEKVYTIKNAEGGKWSIGSSKVKILKQNSETVTIGVITGRSGQFELRYIRENEEDIVLNVTIESL